MSLNPYQQRQDHFTPLIGAGRTSVQNVQVGNVQGTKATQEKLSLVQIYAPTVPLRESIYVKTNFYIQQSQPYIPRRELRTYLYIHYMRWAFLLYCVLCIPMPFLPDFIGWPWAAITGGLGLVWLLIFSQHMQVVYWTIPAVLSQPILSDATQPQGNDFYEFKSERVQGVYLPAMQCGIGMLQRSTGSIEFMALNETAARIVRKSRCLSCCMMWMTIAAVTASAGRLTWQWM